MDRNRENLLVCLLPTGSAHENVKGISHLFEHLLISRLSHTHCSARITGHTTEDYVILFSDGLTSQDIIKTLQDPGYEENELGFHKWILIKEIEAESGNREEFFFPFVWQGTPYMKSPLGTKEEVSTITTHLLNNLSNEIMEKGVFFYSKDGLTTTKGKRNHPCPLPDFIFTRGKHKTYPPNNTCYNIFYSNRQVEALHLLTRILKDYNPEKHIQFSEKKDMSALVSEMGTRFPTSRNVGSLRKKALEELRHKLSGIKANIKERALNELESSYFYDKSWQQRIEELFQTSDRQLLNLAERLNASLK